MNIPSDEKLLIKTKRLILEPILVSHANEMAKLLEDSELYTFIPNDPLDLAKLQKKYELWSKRISPDRDEIWLNWAARLTASDEVVGHFQVGVREGTESNLAYTVGLKWQRKGFALEALHAVLKFVNANMDLRVIKAWIDTRNIASIKLVEKIGMQRVGFVQKADHFKGSDSDEFIYQFSFSQ